ncbi:hypothetical protein MOV98_11535 [Acinetobacter variabilis]|nr:hypothetical protein MOV98_11535 [Acinetobacter variabilis]
MLNYSNAKAGSVVTLKIKGAAKYAHYDFTQTITEADISEATSILQSRNFGWNTFKFVGGEIQQTNDYALKAIGDRSARTYVDQIKGVIFDSNHIANGYNNMPLDSSTAQRCNELGWDCTGTVHRAPCSTFCGLDCDLWLPVLRKSIRWVNLIPVGAGCMNWDIILFRMS